MSAPKINLIKESVAATALKAQTLTPAKHSGNTHKQEKPELKVLLWNVANLGGGFGYPNERSDAVIQAIAHVLHVVGADVCVILEVLQRTTLPRRPKVYAYPIGNLHWSRNAPISQEKFYEVLDQMSKAGVREEVFYKHPFSAALKDAEIRYFWQSYKPPKDADPQQTIKLRKALTEIEQATLEAFRKYVSDVTKEESNDYLDSKFSECCKVEDLESNKETALKHQAYKERAEKWAKEKENKHPGIREFIRIVEALNKLSTDAYISYPEKVPAPNEHEMYKEGETCGFIYKKARCRRIGGGYWQVFTKRSPMKMSFMIDEFALVDIIGYHAPSDSVKNADARSKDFLRLQDVCDAHRAADRLTILASDLNINTFDSMNNAPATGEVSNCESLNVEDYFRQLVDEPGYLSKSTFTSAQTTMRASKVEPSLAKLVEAALMQIEHEGIDEDDGIDSLSDSTSNLNTSLTQTDEQKEDIENPLDERKADTADTSPQKREQREEDEDDLNSSLDTSTEYVASPGTIKKRSEQYDQEGKFVDDLNSPLKLDYSMSRGEIPHNIVNVRPIATLVESSIRPTRFQELCNAFDKIAIVSKGKGCLTLEKMDEVVVPLLQFMTDNETLFIESDERFFHKLIDKPCLSELIEQAGAAGKIKSKTISEREQQLEIKGLLDVAHLLSDHLPLYACYKIRPADNPRQSSGSSGGDGVWNVHMDGNLK